METDVTEILGFPTAPGYGTLNYSEGEVEETIKYFHEQNTQIAVHTHGEDAIDQAIKAFDKVCNRAGLVFKFKFKFIYSHLFNYNTTTIRKKKEELKKSRANYTSN